MENRYKLTIDMKNRVISNTKFKQGDTDSSVLEINLVDNSLAVDITGQTIVFNFAKPDGTIVTQDITTGVSILNALDGNFQCILKNNTLAAPGLVNSEITFSDSGKILSTVTFNFNVDKSIGNGSLSTNYISAIETKIIDIQNTFDVNEVTRQNTFDEAETVRITGDTQRTIDVNEIKADYDAAITLSASNAGLEIVAARKGEVDLPTKIGKIDTQLAEIVNIKVLGAKGDGIQDDAPFIREAFSKGGTIVCPKGTYLLDSLAGTETIFQDNEFVLIMNSNTRVIADKGCIFKLGNDLSVKTTATRGAGVILAISQNNISIDNLTIDFNGNNNLVPVGTTRTGFGVLFDKCTHMNVTNCQFIDCFGQNAIVFGGRQTSSVYGSYGKIQNNYIKNGGSSLVNNTNQNDFSAIYCDSRYVEISGNIIQHDNYPFTYCGGIELHNSELNCHHNIIEKSYPAIYIVNSYTDIIEKNMFVENNIINNCLIGISFAGTGDFNTIKINNNSIKITQFLSPPLSPIGPLGISQPRADNGIFDYTLIVNDLQIINNSIQDTFTTNPIAEKSTGIKLSAINKGIIKNNTISHLSSVAIQLLGCPSGLNNLEISDNQIIDFGLNTGLYGHIAIGLGFDGSSTLPVKSAYDVNGLIIKRNEIIVTGDSTGYSGFVIDWNDDSIISNIVINDNHLFNIPTIKWGTKSVLVDILPDMLFSTNGYITDTNGFTRQWIKTNYNAGINVAQIYNFPIPFKTTEEDKLKKQLKKW